MILWFAVVTMIVAGLGGMIALVAGLFKQGPNDYTLGASLLVSVFLLVQIIISIFAPLAGNPPSGDPLEFWMYLITAFLMPPIAVFWALVDRTKWANIVLAVVAFSVLVMDWRMLVVWGTV